MKRTVRRVLLVTAALATTVFFVGSASAASLDAADGSGLIDVSHQLVDIQKKLDALAQKGQSAKAGRLAAIADCGYGETSQVFLPFGDTAEYALAPGGDLADTSGWSLKNVATSADHDPYSNQAASLEFSRGDSEAVTPVMCVNLQNPTLRFFAADHGGNGKARLDVTEIYEDLDGHEQHLKIAQLKVDETWEPSLTIPIAVNVLALASANGWTPLALDFKVAGLQKGESFSIDGIYVDPYRSR